ncbi:MAG: hypothetical protein KKC37_03110 [Proteobacteria bacterium]|nr:hypothetical protein [Pseudomonadota bacterium]
MSITLCLPDDDRSCFACCPPIRPAGYDHLDWETSLRRLLVDNTERFQTSGPRQEIITGYFCWALGFLDRAGKRIGCLLHPAQNQGRGLRHLTGYGDKCRRESCPQTKVFTGLTAEQRTCLMGLADGLDSFEYSSPKKNLMWAGLSWGSVVMAALTELEQGRPIAPARLREFCPVLTRPDPDGRSYVLGRLIRGRGPRVLIDPDLPARLEALVDRIKARAARVIDSPLPGGTPAHALPFPPALARFINRGLGRARVTGDQGHQFQEMIHREVDRR